MHTAKFCAQQISLTDTQLVYSNDFNVDKNYWIAEFEEPKTSHMKISNGKLELNTSAGATAWYKNKLHGNIMITYYATVVVGSGKNDRVSDMNTFWMATNPVTEDVFNQNGKFSSYNNLHLYYAGIGGHDNTKTRFRKYNGSAGKKILKEFTVESHLLVGNKKYAIKIIVKDGTTQYFIDEVLYWEYKDNTPYTEGYFGFRTTRSHQVYENFRVYELN